MDTKALQGVYEQITNSVVHTSFAQPTDPEEWPVEYILAHVIATNRTLSIVGTQLLDGREASYEGGTVSVSPYWLEAIIASAVDLEGLLTALNHSSREILMLAQRFDKETESKMFPATIYDGHGRILWDGPLAFSDLLTKKLVFHMGQHLKQIQALERDNN